MKQEHDWVLWTLVAIVFVCAIIFHRDGHIAGGIPLINIPFVEIDGFLTNSN